MIEITAQNYQEFAGKNVYRLIDSYGGRKTLQKYDGFAGVPLWKTLLGGPIDCADLAEDMLAVAEERMTREEQAKRHAARLRKAKKAKKETAATCRNCGDPSDQVFCGMCREMGCTVPSHQRGGQ